MSFDAPRAPDVEVDLRAVMRACLRATPFILIFALLCGAGVYYLLSHAEPQYSSEAKLLIQSGDSELTRGNAATEETRALLDREGVASQVQLIHSRELALAVIAQLDLSKRAEFDTALAGPGLVDSLLAKVGLDPGPPAGTVEDRVLASFFEKLNVYAVDNTRVIVIEFTSNDPGVAADAANAVAEQYIVMQRDAKRDTNTDATAWLQDQITGLATKVQTAEAAVEAFRSRSSLFTAGLNNATLAQQQLADLNAELGRVRTTRADAEAKAAQIKEGLEAGNVLNATEVLNSPLIQRLREQQVALQAQMAELSATMLPGHPRVQELRAQIGDIDSQIRGEARKIVTSLESDAALARSRETEISASLDRLKTAVATSNGAEVELRALEREATAQRDLLQTYTVRLNEAVARPNGEFLPADARIVSRASAPVEPYFPKTVPMSVAAVVVGFLLGAGFVLVRALASDSSLRRVAAPAAPLPMVPDTLPLRARPRWQDQTVPVRRMLPTGRNEVAQLAHQVEQSLGAIAERLIVSESRRVLVVMAESPHLGGRPLAAVALARTLARFGRRTVLVDFRRQHGEEHAMGETAGLPGFADLYAGDASFAQVIFRDRGSPAHFIPAGRKPLPADLTSGDRLTTVLDALDHTYDHLVCDVDRDELRVLGPGASAVILVTEVSPSDPRTIRAYEAIAAVSSADVMLLVADPTPIEGRSEAAVAAE